MRQVIRRQWMPLVAMCMAMLLGVVLIGCSSGGNQTSDIESSKGQTPASEIESSGSNMDEVGQIDEGNLQNSNAEYEECERAYKDLVSDNDVDTDYEGAMEVLLFDYQFPLEIVEEVARAHGYNGDLPQEWLDALSTQEWTEDSFTIEQTSADPTNKDGYVIRGTLTNKLNQERLMLGILYKYWTAGKDNYGDDIEEAHESQQLIYYIQPNEVRDFEIFVFPPAEAGLITRAEVIGIDVNVGTPSELALRGKMLAPGEYEILSYDIDTNSAVIKNNTSSKWRSVQLYAIAYDENDALVWKKESAVGGIWDGSFCDDRYAEGEYIKPGGEGTVYFDFDFPSREIDHVKVVGGTYLVDGE